MKFLILIVLTSAIFGSSAVVPVTTQNNGRELIVENGFLSVSFDLYNPSISSLKADFLGKGNFKNINMLARPFKLEVSNTPGFPLASTVTSPNMSPMAYKFIQETDDYVELQFSDITDKITDSPIFSESWLFTLSSDDRYFDFTINGKTIQSFPIVYAAHTLYTWSDSLYGFFDKGVAQMMNNVETCLGANYNLQRGE